MHPGHDMVTIVIVIVIVMTQCVGNGMRRFGSRVLDLILHTSSPGFTGGKHVNGIAIVRESEDTLD